MTVLFMRDMPSKMVGVQSAALSASRMSSERSAGELRPPIGFPSRTRTRNLTFRTRPLCVLSYGDQKTARTQNPLISGKAGWFWTGFAAFGRTRLAAACKASGGIFETVDRLRFSRLC